MNDELRGVGLLLAGSLFFPAVYMSAKYFVTRYFGHRLRKGDIYLISEKCTCSTQALMSFAAGVTIVSNVNDIMKDTHWMTNSYAYFALPYFAHDIWAMFNTFIWNEEDSVRMLPTVHQIIRFLKKSPLLVAHHIVMPMIIFPVLIFFRGNLGDFFVGTFYMIEVTIPFISARFVLAQLKMKATPYYLTAGLLMLSSFFCVRILIFPYLYWRYALYAGIRFIDVPASIPVKCNLGCLMIFLPQVYWFGLMVKGALKYFCSKRSQLPSPGPSLSQSRSQIHDDPDRKVQ